MPTLIAGVVAVILLYSLLQMFRAANPVVLARAIKIGGGIVALAVAAFTGIKGELAVAVPLGIFGAGLLGWSPFGASGFPNIAGIFTGAGAQRSAGQGNTAGGQSRPAPSSKMTDEEAYQILGLQPGAGRDEIGRAHRALMKKLHPDQGGSTYLATRVNEAKDTLLRTHHS
jgi:DnaJ domain